VGGLWDYRDSVWDYRERTWTLDSELVGYAVRVADGRLGTVVHASNAASAAYVVVEVPGGRGMRLVPAGAVTRLCHDQRFIELDLTTVQLENAPTYERKPWDDALRGDHEGYFTSCLPTSGRRLDPR
jgi:hypothetical protein